MVPRGQVRSLRNSHQPHIFCKEPTNLHELSSLRDLPASRYRHILSVAHDAERGYHVPALSDHACVALEVFWVYTS